MYYVLVFLTFVIFLFCSSLAFESICWNTASCGYLLKFVTVSVSLSLSLSPVLSLSAIDADISPQHHQRRGGGGGGRRGCVRWKLGPLWISPSPSTGTEPQHLPAGGQRCRHAALLTCAKAQFLHSAHPPRCFSNYPNQPLPRVIGTNRGKTLLE